MPTVIGDSSLAGYPSPVECRLGAAAGCARSGSRRSRPSGIGSGGGHPPCHIIVNVPLRWNQGLECWSKSGTFGSSRNVLLFTANALGSCAALSRTRWAKVPITALGAPLIGACIRAVPEDAQTNKRHPISGDSKVGGKAMGGESRPSRGGSPSPNVVSDSPAFIKSTFLEGRQRAAWIG